MKGRDKCEYLRIIRKRIADLNNITYNPIPCDHRGNCQGTCPLCDQEAVWLMTELKKREKQGLPVYFDAISLGKYERLVAEPTEVDAYEEEIIHGVADKIYYERCGSIPRDSKDWD